MGVPKEEGGRNETRDKQNNIITSDSALRTIILPQLNNTSSRQKVICECECCISSKSMHCLLLTWRYYYLEILKTKVTTLTTEGMAKQILKLVTLDLGNTGLDPNLGR